MFGWCSSVDLGEGIENVEICKRALYLSPRGLFSAIASFHRF